MPRLKALKLLLLVRPVVKTSFVPALPLPLLSRLERVYIAARDYLFSSPPISALPSKTLLALTSSAPPHDVLLRLSPRNIAIENLLMLPFEAESVSVILDDFYRPIQLINGPNPPDVSSCRRATT
jgi:hypothetical protein